MNGFSVGRVKKSYFTKSQRNLPSTHPQEQFLEIIQIKKQYQTLIKQQLDALQKIENAEIKEISQWQIDIQRKQAKIQALREKEAQKQMSAQEQKQEKLPQQLRGCSNSLIKSQLSKCFTRVYDRLKDYRQYEIKRRASNYFYSSYITKKYFKFWMDECGPAVKKLEQLKIKSKIVENQRKKCLFQFLCGTSTFQQKQSSLLSYLSNKKKQFFFNEFSMITALKKMEFKVEQSIRKSLRKKGLSRCYKFLTEIKKLQELRQKQRLLQNIYCHRKLNSFFNAYREIKFKRQHSKITTSIINKIDLLQLVQTPEQQQMQQTTEQEKQEKEKEPIVKKEGLIKRGRVNTDLLNLILQNFIEEYSQEYQCLLSEQEFSNFLHELKTQCVARLAANSAKRRVLKNLEMNKKQAVLTSITTIINKNHALLALKLNNQSHKKQQQLLAKIKQRQFLCLFKTIKEERLIKLKIDQINSSKMVKNLMKKQVLVHLWSCFNQKKKYFFKKDVAEKWRQSKLTKQTFLVWRTYCQHCQSSVASYKQKDNAIPNGQKLFEDYYDAHPRPQQQLKIPDQQKILVKSKSQQKQIVPYSEQNQYCTTSRVSKAKQQLSRIVNIIGKGIGDRSSLYSSKKSSQSQSSNRPTVTRAKIESDQKDSKQQQILQLKNEEEKKHCQEKEKELQIYLWKSRAYQFLAQLADNASQLKKIEIVKKMLLRASLSNFQEIVEDQSNFKKKNSNIFLLMSIKKQKIVFQNLFSNKQQKQKKYKLSAKLTQNKVLWLLQCIKEKREKQRIKKQNEKKSIDLKQRLNEQIQLNCHSFFESLKKLIIFEKKKKQLKSRHFFAIEMEFIQLIKQCFKEGKKKKSEQLEQLLDSNQEQRSESYEKQQQEKQYEEQSIKIEKQNKSLEEENDASFPQIKEPEKVENYIQDYEQHSDSQKIDNFVNCGHSSDRQQPIAAQRQNQFDRSLHNQIDNYDEQEYQKVDSSLLNGLLIDDEDQATLKKNISANKYQYMPQIDKEGLEYEQAQGQQWIFEKIKLNELKKLLKVKRIIIFFTAFKTFSSKNKSSVQLYFSQNSQTDNSKQKDLFTKQLSEIAMIRKRYAFQKIITEREKIEQQKIRKQQREQIIRFGIQKYEKELKKRAFQGIYSLLNDKWSIKAKNKCFTGWKLYSQQKRMLKEYLTLEAESVANSVSYYPQTMAEKKAFEQIKES